MQYKRNNNSKSKETKPFLFVNILFLCVCLSACLSLSFFLFLSLSQKSVCLTQHSIRTASNSKKGFAIWYDKRDQEELSYPKYILNSPFLVGPENPIILSFTFSSRMRSKKPLIF